MGSSCDSRAERDRSETEVVAGDRYSYRQLDDFTDLISRTLQGAPEVAKIDRKGVLPEQIYLTYSQDRLAEYGLQPSNLKDILGARKITLPGGQLEVGPKKYLLTPPANLKTRSRSGTSSSAPHLRRALLLLRLVLLRQAPPPRRRKAPFTCAISCRSLADIKARHNISTTLRGRIKAAPGIAAVPLRSPSR